MNTIQENVDRAVSNPTALSYGLIGLTTLILGYYTMNDNSSEQEATETAPQETPSEGLFGSEEKKEETGSPIAGLFGQEEAPEEKKEEPSGSLLDNLPFSENEETAEKKVGGKKKKTRRDRKQNKKTAKKNK